jgi:hypothetical protein
VSLRRELLVSFGVQGAGAASVLLATLWLGASQGPEVQGGFNRVKSEIEFAAAFAMFGLPQALFFHVKSRAMSVQGALRWVRWSLLAALPIGAAAAFMQHPREGGLELMGFAVAVAACVAHGELRALVLVGERTAWFNAVTALPQGLVLAGVGAVAVGVLMPARSVWGLLFSIAFGAVAAVAWRHLRAVPVAPPATSSAGWRALGHYGLAAWLTAALSTAAVLAMQQAVEAAEGRAALGRFTMAMTLVQVPLTPISYAAPLLFRRWMEHSGAHASRRWSAGLFAVLLGIAAMAALLSLRWPDLGLGLAYTGATQALALLLVGGAAEAASRVLTVQANASGLPWVAVRAEAARWAVLAIGWLCVGSHGLPWICAVWSAGACAAAVVFVWHDRHVAANP